MSRSIPALVKAPLLIWAREKAGLTVEEAASLVRVAVDELKDWELGQRRPSIAELRALGRIYKRPIAVFFLPEIPQGFDPQREFRRLPGLTLETESSEMRFALRKALYWREAAREIYDRMHEQIPTVRAVADVEEDSEAVGARIRDLLGVSWETQVDWSSASIALNAWTQGRTTACQKSVKPRRGIFVAYI